MFCVIIASVECIPNDIQCNTTFATITKLLNNSYFITDGNNYWRIKSSEKIGKQTGKFTQIRTESGDNLVTNAHSFHISTTFITTFNDKCGKESEKLYALSVLPFVNIIIRLFIHSFLISVQRETNFRWRCECGAQLNSVYQKQMA